MVLSTALGQTWTCAGIVESGLTGGLPFELGRADEAQRRVAPDGIVEAVDVAGQSRLCLGPGLKGRAPDQLAFKVLKNVSTMELS